MSKDDSKRNSKGQFKKGTSGNMKGRPKKIKEPEVNNDLLKKILVEAAGDPYEFQKLALKHGDELNLDLKEAFRIAKELTPYEKPKKASIETKNMDFRRIEVHMIMPEQYDNIAKLYSKRPDLVENAENVDKLIDITGTADIVDEKVVAELEKNVKTDEMVEYLKEDKKVDLKKEELLGKITSENRHDLMLDDE